MTTIKLFKWLGTCSSPDIVRFYSVSLYGFLFWEKKSYFPARTVCGSPSSLLHRKLILLELCLVSKNPDRKPSTRSPVLKGLTSLTRNLHNLLLVRANPRILRRNVIWKTWVFILASAITPARCPILELGLSRALCERLMSFNGRQQRKLSRYQSKSGLRRMDRISVIQTLEVPQDATKDEFKDIMNAAVNKL